MMAVPKQKDIVHPNESNTFHASQYEEVLAELD